MAAVRKMTNAMFSMPNLATPIASTGAEPGGNPRCADIIAGPDKRVDPANETGERDSRERHLDRIIGHQRDAYRKGIAIAPVMMPAWMSRAIYWLETRLIFCGYLGSLRFWGTGCSMGSADFEGSAVPAESARCECTEGCKSSVNRIYSISSSAAAHA